METRGAGTRVGGHARNAVSSLAWLPATIVEVGGRNLFKKFNGLLGGGHPTKSPPFAPPVPQPLPPICTQFASNSHPIRTLSTYPPLEYPIRTQFAIRKFMPGARKPRTRRSHVVAAAHISQRCMRMASPRRVGRASAGFRRPSDGNAKSQESSIRRSRTLPPLRGGSQHRSGRTHIYIARIAREVRSVHAPLAAPSASSQH